MCTCMCRTMKQCPRLLNIGKEKRREKEAAQVGVIAAAVLVPVSSSGSGGGRTSMCGRSE